MDDVACSSIKASPQTCSPEQVIDYQPNEGEYQASKFKKQSFEFGGARKR
jgi:hypothetical protein